MDIYQEIKNQTLNLSPSEVEELKLDAIPIEKITNEIKSKLEEFENLTSLTLNECNLITLENFPVLQNLSRLELCDNKLDGSSLQYLLHLQNLQSLSLGGNKIKTYEDLEYLKKMDNLIDLELLGCEICELEGFKEKIFEIYPRLFLLNNFDKEGNDMDEWNNNDEDINNVVEVISDNDEKKIKKKNDFIIISDDSEEENKNGEAENYFKNLLKKTNKDNSQGDEIDENESKFILGSEPIKKMKL